MSAFDPKRTSMTGMARVSVWDEPKGGRIVPPPTLPPVNLSDLDIEREAKEAVARVAERRIIRTGLDAWREINRAESFDGWRAIGAALHVGKLHALKVTQANAPWGSAYSREFGVWMKHHGFDSMAKSVRSVAIELHENAKAIEAWRATLPERQRKRLVHPLSNVRRWRASFNHGNSKCPADLKRDAVAAWKRFVSCVEMLPTDQALPLWQAAQAQAAVALGG
jgi:hypothetical protein